MNRQFKGALFYVFTDIRRAFLIFWAVLLSVLGLFIILQTILASEETQISFSFSFPIIIFASVVGFLTVKNTLPYLIRMGVTRKSAYISIAIYFLSITLLNAAIAFVLNEAAVKLLGKEMVQGIVIKDETGEIVVQHIASYLGSAPGYQILVDTTLGLFMICLMFLIGLIFYRFQLIGGFTFLAAGLLLFLYGTAKGWVISFFIYVFENFTVTLFGQIFIVSIIIYLISFLMIRRITI